MMVNSHFALNSVLRQYFWSSEALPWQGFLATAWLSCLLSHCELSGRISTKIL